MDNLSVDDTNAIGEALIGGPLILAYLDSLKESSPRAVQAEELMGKLILGGSGAESDGRSECRATMDLVRLAFMAGVHSRDKFLAGVVAMTEELAEDDA